MNTKLPFRLSSIGLLSLAICQMAQAQSTTYTVGGTGTTTSQSVIDENGKPFLSGGLIQAVDPSAVGVSGLNLNIYAGSLQAILFAPPTFSTPIATSSSVNSLASAISSYLSQNAIPASDIVTLSTAPSFAFGITSETFDLIDSLTKAPVLTSTFAASLTTSPTVQVANTGVATRDPSPVSASNTNSLVGSNLTNNAANTPLVTTASSITAAAIGNNQVLGTILASGEQTASVSLLDSSSNSATSTATVTNAIVGVSTAGALTGTGVVTTSNNSVAATARDNDSSATLIGAGTGAGTTPSVNISSGIGFPTAGATVTVTGDLVASGYQIVDSGSNVTASTSMTTVGLAQTAGTTTLNGGITTSGNTISATAGGSRLSLNLTTAVGGGDASAVAYGLQTSQDSNITASTSGVTIGALTSAPAVVTDTPITVTGNSLASAATANTLETTVGADLNIATNSLLVGGDQFLQANTAAVTVSSDVSSSTVGVQQGSGSGSGNTVTVSGNAVTSTAQGNQQTQSVTMAGGAVNSTIPVVINANQTLLAPGKGLSISATIGANGRVNVGVNGSGAGVGTLGALSVSNNNLSAQATGNNLLQNLDGSTASSPVAYSGGINSAITLSPTQITDNTGNAIAVTSGLSNVDVGAGKLGNFSGPLSITDNSLSSTATVNALEQDAGSFAGTVAANLTLSPKQTSTGATATASDAVVNVGLGDSTTANGGTAVAVQVTNNSENAQAGLNSAILNIGTISGNVSGIVGSAPSQTATGGTVMSSVNQTNFGINGDVGNMAPSTSLTWQVDSNTVSAVAQANELTSSTGAVSGSVSGAIGTTNGLGSTPVQISTGNDVSATVGTTKANTITFGITNSASSLSGATTTAIDASSNSVQALARQNSMSDTYGAVTGSLSNGDLGNAITQTSDVTGSTTATTTNVTVGLSGTGPNLGADAGTTSAVSINDNQMRADAAANLAAASLAAGSGSISGGKIEYLATQTSDGTVSANSGNLNLGVTGVNANQADVSPVTLSVNGNQAVTVAAGNSANLATAGFSGPVSGASLYTLEAVQTQDGTAGGVSATASGIGIGLYTGGNVGAGAAFSGTISNNSVVTSATANSAAASTGTLVGSLGTGSELATLVNQTSTNTDLIGSTSNVSIGLGATGNIGGNGAVPVSVSRNAVQTTATANSSNTSEAVQGSVAGIVGAVVTQSSTLGALTGVSATTTGVQIGVGGGTVQNNLSASVSSNTVSAGSAGNDLSDQVSISGAQINGQVGSNGSAFKLPAQSQSLSGPLNNPGVVSELNSVSVGVSGATGSVNAASSDLTVSGNQLLSTAVGNSATRSVNVSGVLNGAGATQPLVSLNDNQSISNTPVTAFVDGAPGGATGNTLVGVSLSGGAVAPLNLVVSGNQVQAQAVGNSSVQQVSLNGASVAALAATSLSATQSLTNSAIMAQVANVTVGITSAANLGGGSGVVSGNSIAATAVGNSTSLKRGGS